MVELSPMELMTAWMGLELPPIPPVLHYAEAVHVHGGPPIWLR